MYDFTLKELYKNFDYYDSKFINLALKSIISVLNCSSYNSVNIDSNNIPNLFIYPQNLFKYLKSREKAMLEEVKFYFVREKIFYMAYYEKDREDTFVVEAKPLSEICDFKVYQDISNCNKTQLFINFKDKTNINIDVIKDSVNNTQLVLYNKALLKIVENMKS